jgi:hypothetical protein
MNNANTPGEMAQSPYPLGGIRSSGVVGEQPVTTLTECTVPEKILLAAFALDEAGQSPFSAEALIVASWKKYPQSFGLKGFAEQYPDSNKVLASIMGEKGLARKGWLDKMGQKLYALTREGRQIVRRLQTGESAPSTPKASSPQGLPRDHDKMLQHLFSSTAWHKVREGRQQELAFASDACRFWGITQGMNGDAVDGQVEKVRATLAAVEVYVGLGNAVLGDGRSITAEDVASLMEVHRVLEQRFARHLNVYRTRPTPG